MIPIYKRNTATQHFPMLTVCDLLQTLKFPESASLAPELTFDSCRSKAMKRIIDPQRKHRLQMCSRSLVRHQQAQGIVQRTHSTPATTTASKINAPACANSAACDAL